MRLPYAPILLTSCALAIPLAASPEAQTGDMDGLKSMGYSKYSPYYSYGPYGSAVEAEAAKQEKRDGSGKLLPDNWYGKYTPYEKYGAYSTYGTYSSAAEEEAAKEGKYVDM